jgi:hypothetical protein
MIINAAIASASKKRLFMADTYYYFTFKSRKKQSKIKYLLYKTSFVTFYPLMLVKYFFRFISHGFTSFFKLIGFYLDL